MYRFRTVWLAFCLAVLPVQADERSAAIAEELAGHYRALQTVPALEIGPGLAEAERVQDAYVARLRAGQGRLIGYKAGLTGVAAQRRFGVDHPLLGMLLRDMLLPSPARLSVHGGARLLVEADLLVRVGDVSINSAKDWGGLLRALDAVIPFVEVPDLLYAEEVTITAPMLQAVNVGARWGVTGAVIPLRPGEDWYRRLVEFQVRLQLPQGPEVAAQGRDLLGHPLAVVEWLRDAVHARGRQLNPGDLLSLGSLTALRPVQPGALRAVYTGLDPAGPVSVDIEFVTGTAVPEPHPQAAHTQR